MRKTDRWKRETIWRCKTAGLNKGAPGVDVHMCITRGLVIDAHARPSKHALVQKKVRLFTSQDGCMVEKGGPVGPGT